MFDQDSRLSINPIEIPSSRHDTGSRYYCRPDLHSREADIDDYRVSAQLGEPLTETDNSFSPVQST